MGLLLVEDRYYNLKNKNEIYLFRISIYTMMVDSYERYIEFLTVVTPIIPWIIDLVYGGPVPSWGKLLWIISNHYHGLL